MGWGQFGIVMGRTASECFIELPQFGILKCNLQEINQFISICHDSKKKIYIYEL